MTVKFELLKLRPVYLRLDTLPFVFIYAGLLHWQLTMEEETLKVKN